MQKMEFFSVNVVYWVGAALIFLGALFLVLLVVGVVVALLYLRTSRILIPRITLFIISLAEGPLKQVLWLFNVDEEIVNQMILKIRNSLYRQAYCEVPFDKRAVFMPQCLRSPQCPAKLGGEGIQCAGCGGCGLGPIKEECERLGSKFFIVPGSSFVRRMIKKYKPQAILGVGCSMEVKEGTAMVASLGMPVQSVTLIRDGCVDTRADVEELLEKIHCGANPPPDLGAKSAEIARCWGESRPSQTQVEDAKIRYQKKAEDVVKKAIGK